MEDFDTTQFKSSRPSTCPVCDSTEVQDTLELQQMPVLSNVLWKTREEALNASRADICLVFCKNCGHMFNQAFDSTRIEYDVPYENSLHFSARFQEYASWLANYLVVQYDLHGKSIIEIGSGSGDFLRTLCDIGGNVGTGFDPSHQPTLDSDTSSVSLVQDVYSARYSDRPADMIISRHVLEHIPEPAAFIRELREIIGDRKQTIIFFEVPNLAYILRDTAVWDIIYEHYSYFSAHSLAYLFTRHGFNVLNYANAFGGQFLFIEALPRDVDHPAPNSPYANPVTALNREVQAFSTRGKEKLERWRNQIDDLQSSGKKIVLWGAGSKGISFLNLMRDDSLIKAIVDINPRKHGMFVTGAGQEIIPPERLIEYQPDLVIAMNPMYEQEIRDHLNRLNLHVDLQLAL